jgi:hypothetical protein
MLPLSWILIGLLALSPLVTYGAMAVREKIITAGAVKAERVAQRAICDGRVAEVGRAHDRAVADAASEALEAARAVSATPDTLAELQALCARSSSCRKPGN